MYKMNRQSTPIDIIFTDGPEFQPHPLYPPESAILLGEKLRDRISQLRQREAVETCNGATWDGLYANMESRENAARMTAKREWRRLVIRVAIALLVYGAVLVKIGMIIGESR